MNKSQLITKLLHSKTIWGTLWGNPKTQKHGLVEIKISNIVYCERENERVQLLYSIGCYASDIISYYLDEYGLTWAFTKEELEDE